MKSLSCTLFYLDLLLLLLLLLFLLLKYGYLFVNQFLASEAGGAASIFDDLQSTLSTHQGEMALFARELRQVCSSIFLL